MDVNPDYKDILSALSAEKARFLLVGAHAVAYYTEPRYTKDFDIWVECTARNAERVWRALSRFGAPLEHVRLEDFTNPNMVYQIGKEPRRIDIIMDIEGLSFSAAWRRRITTHYGGVPLHILGQADLVKAKRAAGRPQDQLDLQRLTAPRSKPRRSHRRR